MLVWINHVLNFDSYMTHIDRVFSPSYMPNDQDVLFSFIPTQGITQVPFMVGEASVHIPDVSGSRVARRKWIHAFEGSRSLLFLISLSGYNECIPEDRTVVCNISLVYISYS